MLLERCSHGFQQPFSCLGHIAGKYDCLWINHRCIVGHTQSQNLSRSTEHLDSHLITLIATICNSPYIQLLQFTKQCRLIAFGYQFFSRLDQSLLSAVSLQTPLVSTTTLTSVHFNTSMPQLTSKAIISQVRPSPP